MDCVNKQPENAEQLIKQLEDVSSYLKVLNVYLKKKLETEKQHQENNKKN